MLCGCFQAITVSDGNPDASVDAGHCVARAHEDLEPGRYSVRLVPHVRADSCPVSVWVAMEIDQQGEISFPRCFAGYSVSETDSCGTIDWRCGVPFDQVHDDVEWADLHLRLDGALGVASVTTTVDGAAVDCPSYTGVAAPVSHTTFAWNW
jgi:hypothetical protein